MNKEDRPIAGDSNCVLELTRVQGPSYTHSLLFAQLAAESVTLYAGGAHGHPDQDRPNIRVGTYDVPEAYREQVKKIYAWYFPELVDHNQYTDVSLVVFKNVPMHSDDAFRDSYFLNVMVHTEGAFRLSCLDEYGGMNTDREGFGPYEVEPVEGDAFIMDPRVIHSVVQLEIPDGLSVMLQFVVDRKRFDTIQR